MSTSTRTASLRALTAALASAALLGLAHPDAAAPPLALDWPPAEG